MKKIVYGLLIFSLIGCSPVNQEEMQTELESESTETVLPAEEPTLTPEPTPDMNDPLVVLDQMMINPEVVLLEDANAMAENDGGQFGFVSIKNYNTEENVFEFSVNEGESAWVPLNTMLDEFGANRQAGSNQAIYMKFQPPAQSNTLVFDFMGLNEFGIDFQNGGKPSLFWFVDAYNEQFEGDLALQFDTYYYLVMAIDSDGKFRSVIWEDGVPENRATFSSNFAERQNGEGYQNQTWKFIIGFGGPDTLKIAEYGPITFDGFNN